MKRTSSGNRSTGKRKRGETNYLRRFSRGNQIFFNELLQSNSRASRSLYIWIEVNGVSTIAFVDSGIFGTSERFFFCSFTGSGGTCMQYSFAVKVGLASDIDTIYRSTCCGLYTVKTVGDIHSCECFTILKWWKNCCRQIRDRWLNL